MILSYIFEHGRDSTNNLFFLSHEEGIYNLHYFIVLVGGEA